MFSLSVWVFVLRSEPSQPQRGACCGGAAYFGLTLEASAWGRAAPNTALFVLQEGAFVGVLSRWEQAKELTVVSPPQLSHVSLHINRNQPVPPSRTSPPPDVCRATGLLHTASVPSGDLGLRHFMVTSKKCHLPAPYHSTCSAGQESLATMCRCPTPRGEAGSLHARMELGSVLATLPKSPHPHTLHRAMCVPPHTPAAAHRDRECCQLP